MFTDTDTCFYAPIHDVGSAAEAAGLVLLPTAIRPVNVRRYFPAGQIEYREWMNGLFNCGLLAVGQGGKNFVEWWAGLLARDCLREPSAGMWVDQLWLDWAPVYFEHLIMRDGSVNVAFWNLDEREPTSWRAGRRSTALRFATSTSPASTHDGRSSSRRTTRNWQPSTSRCTTATCRPGRRTPSWTTYCGDTHKISFGPGARSCASVRTGTP